MRVSIIGGEKPPHNDFLEKIPPAPAVDTPAPPRTIPHCTTLGCTGHAEPRVPHTKHRRPGWRCLDCRATQPRTPRPADDLYCHQCHREQLDERDMSGSTSHLCVTCEDADTQIEHARIQMGWG